jgi:hypothetical protein
MAALVDDSLHYIRNGDGVEELYAYRVDSTETSNLARSPDHQASLVRYRTAVERLTSVGRTVAKVEPRR